MRCQKPEHPMEALNKLIPLMVRQGSPEFIEGLTTNRINNAILFSFLRAIAITIQTGILAAPAIQEIEP